MILSGIAGKGSGKLGSQVYSSVAGQQVVRAYQPIVANPNTTLQVNTRARFKLMSQLSAVFSPILAYRKKGAQTPRNQFVKRNFDSTTGNDGQVIISLENLQITGGTAGLPGIHAVRDGLGHLTLSLVADAGTTVSRVVYVIFKKTGTAQMQLIGSVVANEPGADGLFPITVADVAGDLVLYAYGILDMNTAASAAYGNYTVNSGEDIARLVMTRKMTFTNYRFTRTRGCQLNANETEIESAGPRDARVFVTPSGSGTVTGFGKYQRGETITIQAIPEPGNSFIGWLQNGTTEYVAYSPTLIFEADGLVDLVAIFQNPESSTGGLNGEEQTNPLPSNAVVTIDLTVQNVASGLVDLDTSFDTIEVDGLLDIDELVFVPEGSFYGNDDNATFEWDGTKFLLTASGSGNGAVYFNGMVWFYIDTMPWVNPYPEAEVKCDNVAIPITSQEVAIATEPDYVTIQGLTEDEVVTAIHDDQEVAFEYDENTWHNRDTGIDLPLAVYVNDELWFTLIEE